MGSLSTAGKWWIAGGCTVAGIFIVYTFFGFFGVPALIRWGLTKYADPIVARQITASDIYFNPYTLYLNIKGLNIQKANDNIPLLHVDDINTKVSWDSLFKLAPILDHLTIDGLQANIVRTGLAQFNFSDIIDNVMAMQSKDDEKDKKEEEKPSEPFRFAVYKSEILNSGIVFVDKYRGRTDRISNFDFTLPMVSNFIDEIDVPIKPELSFRLNGHPFSSDANSLPFTLSQKTGVTFTFNGLSLENLASFNPVQLNALITGGTLSANLNLNFANDDQKASQVKELRLKGNVQMKDIVIQDIYPRTPYDVVKIDSIDIDLKKLAVFAQEIELGDVKISSPDILVVRNNEGINLAELASHIIRDNPLDAKDDAEKASEEKQQQEEKEEIKKETKEEQKAEASPWLWSLANLTVEDGIVRFQDKTNGFAQDVAPLNISVNSVSSAPDTESQLAFSTALIDGRVAINGQFSINPVKAKLRVQSADLNIAEGKPYFDEFLNGSVKGIISNDGTASFALEDSKPVFGYTGEMAVDEFNVQNGKGKDVVSLSALNLKDINVEGHDTKVSVKGNVALEDFALSDPRVQPPVQAVKFKEFTVGIDNIAIADQKAAVGEVKLVEPEANVALAGSKINLVELGQYLAESLIKEASAKEPAKSKADKVAKPEAEKTEKVEVAADQDAKNKDASDKAEKTEADKDKVEVASDKEDMAKADEHKEPAKSWIWSLEKATIENGNVHFVDETNNFSQNITPINITVSSLSSELKETGEVNFNTNLIGGTVAVNGIVGVNPVMGNLNVQTQNLDIAAGMPYIQEFLNGALAGFVSNDGTVTFAIDNGEAGYNYAGDLKVEKFNLTTPKGAPIASFNNLSLNKVDLAGKNDKVAVKGLANLADFVLSDPRGGSGNHLVRLKEVNVNIQEVDTKTQVANVGDVKVIAPSANVVMSANGINLAELGEYLASSLVKQPSAQAKKPAAETKKETAAEKKAEAEAKKEEAAAKKAAPQKAPAPWKWNVAKVQVAEGNVQFTDSTNNFSKNITPITATAGPISQNFGNPIEVNANVGVLGGTVSANGSVTISPLKANIKAKTAGLQIPEAMPFISPFLNARITEGQVGNDGTVVFSMNGNSPNVQYEGSVNVNKLNVTDAQGVPVASLGSLSASGINLKYSNDISVAVQNLAIGNPLVNVVTSAQGVMNVSTLVKDSGGAKRETAAPARRRRGANRTAAQAEAQAPASSGLPAISLGHITLTNGIVRYRDNETRPPFTLTATSLRGTVSNISTTANRPAQVNITGLLNGTPMSANGTVNPFSSNLQVNMNTQVTALSLPAFSPFSSEFTGYPITQGQLTYKGTIDINNQKLNSTNNITINKLEFGNENPNAKDKLPVKLAVSLLANRNGEINLNLPINGSLADPNFSVGGVIVKVLTNLITKAVTAPFTIIGDIGSGITDLFTGGSSNVDANNLHFASGSAQLTPEDQQALNVVAKAMNDRPSMNIQVTGYATEDFDRGPLADAMLTRQMRFALGTNSRELSQSQRNRATGMLFSDAYGPNKPNTRNPDEQYQFLQQNVRVTSQEFEGLANQRAQNVRNYLINQLNINPSRVFIVGNNGNPPPEPGVGVSITIQN